jgi:hypothetical protein
MSEALRAADNNVPGKKALHLSFCFSFVPRQRCTQTATFVLFAKLTNMLYENMVIGPSNEIKEFEIKKKTSIFLVFLLHSQAEINNTSTSLLGRSSTTFSATLTAVFVTWGVISKKSLLRQ